jgi:hypothetical protein
MSTNTDRVNAVNRELARRGYPERLRRGPGYYYFSGGGAALWPTSGVYVYRADSLTVEEWMAEHDRLWKAWREL